MKQVIIASLLMVLAINVQAGRGQNREARQENRIKQGVQSGELTKHEAKRLARGQKKVDRFQEKAMADGVMSPEEKVKLEQMQDRQSKRIYKQKHDGQAKPEVKPDAAAAPATAVPAVEPEAAK
jgi:hypothetical protein